MVTEFFGMINVSGSEDILKRIKKGLSYKVPHFLHITEFSEGIAGSVSIGRNYPGNVQVDDELVLFADVSIYNRSGFSAEAKIPENLCDEFLLLKAYRSAGEKMLLHLDGDFAFAIWDKNKKELFCARDFPGIRPFYYAINGEGIIFGSELNFVKALFPGKPELNNEYLLDSLVTVISDKEITAFQNVYRLPPGHILKFKNGRTGIQKYTDIDPEKKIRYSNRDEYTSAFKKMLVNSVEKRCGKNGVLGSELSGGLDSSLVTSVAHDWARKNGIPFFSFSNILPVGHGTGLKDEKEHIQKVISAMKIPWKEVWNTGEKTAGLFKHSLNIQGCFTQQRFHVFNYGVYKAAGKEGVDVLLSGFGGDEVTSARTGFGWNDMIGEKEWKEFFKALRYNRSFFPSGILKGLKHLAKYYLKGQNHGNTFGVFTPEMLNKRFASLALRNDFSEKNRLRERYISRHRRQKMRFFSYRQTQKILHPHVPQRLEYSYAAAASFGIRYRYPLLDKDLIQTFISFPAWVKHQPGQDRFLFRQAMEGLVPPDIQMRSDKSGTVIPHISLQFMAEKDILLKEIEYFSKSERLQKMFDFSRFPQWFTVILERNEEEMNYLMPGAFYNYLMLMYFLTGEEEL